VTESRKSPFSHNKILAGLLILAFLACLALFAFNSLTRSLKFSPDSMSYIDVAQNIAEGRGLNHAYLMLDVPDQLTAPGTLAPLLLWGPLYPILIATLHLAGLPFTTAALLIPILGAALILLLAHLFLRSHCSLESALMALAGLLACSPLYRVSLVAWSETTGIALVLAGVYFLASRQNGITPLLAGMAFGLAYAARFALLPAPFIGLLFIALHKPPHHRKKMAILCLGFLVITFPLFLRNFLLAGNPLGPPRPPSTLGFFTNLRYLGIVLFQQYLDPATFGPENQVRFLLSAVVLIAGVTWLKKRFQPLRSLLLSPPILLLLLWSFGYMAFLVLYRTRYSTDPIDLRLLSPAMIPLILVFAAITACAFQMGPKTAYSLLIIVLAVTITHEIRFALNTPPASVKAQHDASERLKWISANTTGKDLIIGDSTMDIPMYCGFRNSLCFIPSSPESSLPSYDQIHIFLQHHGKEFNRAFIVIRAGFPDEPLFDPRWTGCCGPFIADLIYHRLDAYPDITPLPRVKDAFLFEMTVP